MGLSIYLTDDDDSWGMYDYAYPGDMEQLKRDWWDGNLPIFKAQRDKSSQIKPCADIDAYAYDVHILLDCSGLAYMYIGQDVLDDYAKHLA